MEILSYANPSLLSVTLFFQDGVHIGDVRESRESPPRETGIAPPIQHLDKELCQKTIFHKEIITTFSTPVCRILRHTSILQQRGCLLLAALANKTLSLHVDFNFRIHHICTFFPFFQAIQCKY